MRHSQRFGTGLVPVIAGLAFCAVSIGIIAYKKIPDHSVLQRKYENVISANKKASRPAANDRAGIINEVLDAFRAEIDEAVRAARPAGNVVARERYGRFMDGFKAELYDGLRAHLDTYTDPELRSLTKPQWDLVASDLEVGARFREWLNESAPQIVDRVHDAQRSASRTAQREKNAAAQSARPSVEGPNRPGMPGRPSSPRAEVSPTEDDHYFDRDAAQSAAGKFPRTYRTTLGVAPVVRRPRLSDAS